MDTRTFLLGIALLILSTTLQAQASLDAYIQQALESNIALKRKNLSYEKSLQALKEAKANFLPQLSLQSRYSIARGGRAIFIPAGDLVNPAYQNLNIINQLGQSTSPDYPVIPEYPNVPNQSINFLRETEQESFFRVAMPIFNNAIIANQKIQGNLVEADRIGVDAYKRELIQEVKTAYYNHQKANEAVELFNNTLVLVRENLRTTQSLFDNHKITKDAVYLAEAQVEEVKQQLATVEKDFKVTQAFFNYLLNRDYDASIEINAPATISLEASSLESAREKAVQTREELEQLNYYIAAADNNIQLNKGNNLPTINLAADHGIQGRSFSFERDADYFMGSVVMTWNLFQPNNKAKVQQAEIEKRDLFQQKEDARQQIGLQVVQAWYEVEAARKAITQAEAEWKATRQAFRLVDKKYQLGQANQVSWLDARTRMTTAEQNQIIARYEYLNKLAVLERATGSYQL